MQYMYMVKTQAKQKSQKVEISLHTSLTCSKFLFPKAVTVDSFLYLLPETEHNTCILSSIRTLLQLVRGLIGAWFP